jgi:DNA-directed RNA polymerase subunit RPC12/RpoP
MATTSTAPRGIPCPKCGGVHARTVCTLRLPNQTVKRYKRCRGCGYHVITLEARPGRVSPLSAG